MGIEELTPKTVEPQTSEGEIPADLPNHQETTNDKVKEAIEAANQLKTLQEKLCNNIFELYSNMPHSATVKEVAEIIAQCLLNSPLFLADAWAALSDKDSNLFGLIAEDLVEKVVFNPQQNKALEATGTNLQLHVRDLRDFLINYIESNSNAQISKFLAARKVPPNSDGSQQTLKDYLNAISITDAKGTRNGMQMITAAITDKIMKQTGIYLQEEQRLIDKSHIILELKMQKLINSLPTNQTEALRQIKDDSSNSCLDFFKAATRLANDIGAKDNPSIAKHYLTALQELLVAHYLETSESPKEAIKFTNNFLRVLYRSFYKTSTQSAYPLSPSATICQFPLADNAESIAAMEKLINDEDELERTIRSAFSYPPQYKLEALKKQLKVFAQDANAILEKTFAAINTETQGSGEYNYMHERLIPKCVKDAENIEQLINIFVKPHEHLESTTASTALIRFAARRKLELIHLGFMANSNTIVKHARKDGKYLTQFFKTSIINTRDTREAHIIIDKQGAYIDDNPDKNSSKTIGTLRVIRTPSAGDITYYIYTPDNQEGEDHDPLTYFNYKKQLAITMKAIREATYRFEKEDAIRTTFITNNASEAKKLYQELQGTLAANGCSSWKESGGNAHSAESFIAYYIKGEIPVYNSEGECIRNTRFEIQIKPLNTFANEQDPKNPESHNNFRLKQLRNEVAQILFPPELYPEVYTLIKNKDDHPELVTIASQQKAA